MPPNLAPSRPQRFPWLIGSAVGLAQRVGDRQQHLKVRLIDPNTHVAARRGTFEHEFMLHEPELETDLWAAEVVTREIVDVTTEHLTSPS